MHTFHHLENLHTQDILYSEYCVTLANIPENTCIHQSAKAQYPAHSRHAACCTREKSDNPTLTTSNFYVHKELGLPLKQFILN